MVFKSENLDAIIDLALREDIGGGDVTTLACVDPHLEGIAEIVCKSDGTLAGQIIARQVFEKVDAGIAYRELLTDGSAVRADTPVADISGKLASILTAERTALNFLMRLSGVATITRKFVDEVAGTGAKILDTRKTSPGLREAEKYAVVCGGGSNHRKGLYDMILIKDNHIQAAGSVAAAVRRCFDYVSGVNGRLQIEVEAGSAEELEQALASGAGWIMLDNMHVEQIREAVGKIRRRSADIRIEVSGGVTFENVRRLAECGVDYISVGALTHSARSLDFSLSVARGSQ